MLQGSASFDKREPKVDVPQFAARRLSSSSALTLSGILSSVRLMNHQTIRQRAEPAFIEPMQCKPVTALPTEEEWTFEIKFDGYRCIAVKLGREVTLFSRNEKVLNRGFQRVVEALASLKGEFVLDGELVAIDPQGRPSFQLLQSKLSLAVPVYFYAFDLLNRDGESLVHVPIERRRDLLGSTLPEPEDPLRLSRYCERLQDKFLPHCANSVSKVSWASATTSPRSGCS